MNERAASGERRARTCLLLAACCLLRASLSHGASSACSGEVQWLLQKAVVCFDQSDFGCAKIKVQAALEREPECAEALWIKSFLAEHDGKTEERDALREKALKLNPKLSDFWEERGHGIEALLSQQEFSHFELRFYGAEDRDHAWQAVKHLNEAYDEMSSRFGMEPPKKIPVIVFTTYEFLDAWRSPFIGGFFDKRDGKVRVRVDEIRGGEEEFRRVARHEFTHAFMHQFYAKDLPLWFMEGTAQFYAYLNPNDGFWKDKRLDEIRKTRKGQPFLTFGEIEEAIGKKRVAPLKIYLAYLESEALILQIAKDRGDSWIPHVFASLRQGASFADAFQEVIGITPERALEHLQHAWE